MKEVRHTAEILSGLADLWPWDPSVRWGMSLEMHVTTWHQRQHFSGLLRCCDAFCSQMLISWCITYGISPWASARNFASQRSIWSELLHLDNGGGCVVKRQGLSLPYGWTLHDCGGEKCRPTQMFHGGGDVNAVETWWDFLKWWIILGKVQGENFSLSWHTVAFLEKTIYVKTVKKAVCTHN